MNSKTVRISIRAVLLVATALLLLNCRQPLAGLQREQRPTPSGKPPQAQGTITHEQVVPEKGDLPPAPELTPEERERLLQGTMRRVPDPPRSDPDRPSPPPR